MIKLYHPIGALTLSLLLSACGGGGSSNDGNLSDTDRQANNTVTGETPQALSITGADTASLGTDLDVAYYAYRPNANGVDHFLAAASSASAIDFVRVGLGEISPDVIDINALQQDELNSVVVNITELGISMRVNINGAAWLYSLTCVGGCDSIMFDAAQRTVTITDAVVTHLIGGDDNSQATNSLTINATLIWSAADENPNAPPYTQNTDQTDQNDQCNNNGGNNSGVSLADIIGVWDTSEELGVNNMFDESYTVINADCSVISYDYQGDPDGSGDNCYIKDEATITDLGGGRFINDQGFEVTLTPTDDGFVAEPGSEFFRATTRLESDFVPLCD